MAGLITVWAKMTKPSTCYQCGQAIQSAVTASKGSRIRLNPNAKPIGTKTDERGYEFAVYSFTDLHARQCPAPKRKPQGGPRERGTTNPHARATRPRVQGGDAAAGAEPAAVRDTGSSRAGRVRDGD